MFLDNLKSLSKKYSIFIITSQDNNKKKQLKILKKLKNEKIIKNFHILIYRSKLTDISNLEIKKNKNFGDILLTEVPKNLADTLKILYLYKT